MWGMGEGKSGGREREKVLYDTHILFNDELNITETYLRLKNSLHFLHSVKKSVDFTLKYLASGCQFTCRYICRTF